MGSDDLRALKIEAARAALKHIGSNMTVGLGTGSTAVELVKLLGDKIRSGELQNVTAVCTSKVTEHEAVKNGIRIVPLEDLPRIAVAIDGADEIDPQLRLIKGAGGALLREKIIEQAAEKFVVIADHTKEVDRLGTTLLPVEVVKFAAPLLQDRFERLGFAPVLREKGGKTFLTDESHWILDLKVPEHLEVGAVVEEVRQHAGVVETGYFAHEATEAIIASPEGVRTKRRSGV